MKSLQTIVIATAAILLTGSSCTLLESEFPFEGTFASYAENASQKSWDTLLVEQTEKDTYRITRRGISEDGQRRIPLVQTRIYQLDELHYDLRYHGNIIRPDGHDGSLIMGDRRFRRIK